VGWDKNSLTERQREKKIITIILIERIYSMQCSHCLMLSLLLSSKFLCFSQLPHINTEHYLNILFDWLVWVSPTSFL